MSTSLIKPGLKTALAEALYQEILTNSNNYYYFLGNTLTWNEADNPPLPQNTNAYDKYARREMIFLKKITTADVAFTIDRYDWASGEVFDKYDDQIGLTINVADCSGTVTSGTPYIISSGGSVFDVTQIAVGYAAIGTGIAAGAKVVSVQADRVAVSLPHTGTVSGTVSFKNVTPSGADAIENAKMYCVTSDNRVYKCLDNDGNSPSTVKPFSTSLSPIRTSDGYVWKYMYTIPAAMINKFMTATDIPVTTAVRDQYYTRGSLSTVAVDDYGTGYQIGDQLVVRGDGYLKDNKYKILTATLTNLGLGYTTAPTVTVDDPFTTIAWEPSSTYLLGEYVKTSQGKIYEVVAPGLSDSSYEPTHSGIETITNGTLSLKFVGLTPTITTTIDGSGSVDSATLSCIVGYVSITSPGYGYDSGNPPSIVISSSTGSGAIATSQVVDGRLYQINVIDRGYGYEGTSDVTASIEPPIPAGQWTAWTTGSTVSVDDILRVVDAESTRYYKITQSGVIGAASSDTSTSTEFTTGTAKAIFIAQNALAVVELYYGFGYSVEPGVSVEYPFEYSEDPLVAPWSEDQEVSEGDVVEYQGRFYTVHVDQNNTPLNSTPPLHASGSESGFGPAEHDITLEFFANAASISITAEKTQATLSPVIENGQITSVIVDDAGIGYTNSSISISAFGGGYGAQLRPITSYGDLGSRQANVELLAVPGTVDSINMINPGSGYTGNFLVTVTGDGDGAVARAYTTNGAVTSIVVEDSGVNYTYADVSLPAPSDEDGTQAYARAIVSPVLGHGKNAVNELYATNITLSSTISTEKNQGIDVLNDYRQVGVIKNPYQFGTQLRFNRATGTTCYAVSGAFESPARDMMLYDEDFDPDGTPNGNRYRVVAVASTSESSTLVVQSLDNAPITTLYYKVDTVTKQITPVSKIAYPTVDKYSGELMFIDNRNAFLPKTDQVISFKTVIKL